MRIETRPLVFCRYNSATDGTYEIFYLFRCSVYQAYFYGYQKEISFTFLKKLNQLTKLTLTIYNQTNINFPIN